MARLVEPRDSAEVTVTVRHRCPTFAFGSALGPRALATYWILTLHGFEIVWVSAIPNEFDSLRIRSAVLDELGGSMDYRRHLDELQELPEG
jgi:hypothetical protein